ncbi:hypothetical protein GMB86_05550 [Terrilactibacillus sp. BCM23-1]|uniref:Uncharacterized protein n=1 Tax=Terrilactibacillus tamarindi TaxID=2599694 RepID=A0A6N8CN00_9BACI|nr:hypothetical protein [Terrilactibacillus tamarindi]MTT31484.1 hypothetical protein [Terrilactibacillus tamarindi]
MDLKLKNKDVLIEGIALPMPFQISLKKRGKTVVNHRYVEDVKELQVLCPSCNQWHLAYKLDNDGWEDINQTYKLCNKGKTNEYFDTYCLQCYKTQNKVKDDSRIENRVAESNEKDAKSREEGQYLPWSEKAGGVQQTIFLAPDLDMYLKLYGVYHSKKKNELLNDIIAEFKSKNPINL